MKKITIKRTGDILYQETLDNGLQIYMVPKNNLNTTHVSFNVKYGAMHNEFIPLGKRKMVRVPNGIAHFLEHKMFAQEEGVDPMIFFASNGADVNAYTSLYNTAYYFSGPSHLDENIEYLLNFVQTPYFTDENVNKEKGIIEEEIKMYEDDPYSFLDEEVRLNAFSAHPVKFPVAGYVEDIKNITKEDLYTCYNTFYHPSNMFVTISGNFDVEHILEVIKANQAKKTFESLKKITLKNINEPNEVTKEFEEKQMNVEVPKIAVSFKISVKDISMDPKKRDLYLAIIFDSLFGPTSKFNEEMKEKNYLVSYVVIETVYTLNHLLVTLSADTNYPEELIKSMKNVMNNIAVEEEDFSNKKKMLISNNVYVYEDVDAINRYVVNDLILYGKYYVNIENLLDSLNKIELDNLLKQLDFNNLTALIIKPINKIVGSEENAKS